MPIGLRQGNRATEHRIIILKHHSIKSVMGVVLCSFLMGCTTPAPEKVSNIRFSDTRFMECVLNTGIDNVEEITRLDCPNMDIKHVDEIKYFNQLSYIDLHLNEIQNLDLSANKKLQYINIGAMLVESLKFGDLEHLEHLEFGAMLTEDFLTKISLESQFPKLEQLIIDSLPDNTEFTLSIKHDNVKFIRIYSYGQFQSHINLTLDVEAPLLNELEIDVRGLEVLQLKDINQLETLSVIKSKLMELSLIGLENLQVVFLNNNKLNTLLVKDLPKLKVLDVSYNQLISLDTNTLTELRQLDVSHNQLNSIKFPPQSKITAMNIKDNLFESFTFDELPELEYFSLKNNPLPRIDDAITNNAFLQCITNNGEHSYFLEIVSIYCQNPIYLNRLNLSKMKSITSLMLLDLSIKSGELDLSSLKNIKYLDIKSRAYTISKLVLPSGTNIETINLQKLGLKALTIPPLPKLQSFILDSDKLGEIYLSQLPSLEYIKLYGFSLTELKMKPLPKLVELILSNTGIKVQTIKNMASLKRIMLLHTELEELHLYELPHLEQICLRSFGTMSNLKIFSDFSKDKIQYFIGNCKLREAVE
ncbi:hypothetical protein Sps_03865 [Shewanella psychrophila]|uniref:Uncharacterized protein n=1 Tax=Shewanella psychrophila TaxID=225848 RepID=A0A1S6HTU1_9GAMM|nr:leucine-rich repeat domain-containing protein [Shewanella psychrophila]AQS38980.1 hypothetical protein Sps_03865 [Shewanella psychrophila]